MLTLLGLPKAGPASLRAHGDDSYITPPPPPALGAASPSIIRRHPVMSTAPRPGSRRRPRLRLAALPPLALYVHVPWCVRKCPYCDFNSHELRETLPEGAYVDALDRRPGARAAVGMGTAGALDLLRRRHAEPAPAAAIDRLLAAFRARLQLAADAEITLEANPGTFEAEKFRDFRAAGVNRLSIGIQSFNPARLKALGRIHDDREARRAIEIAHAISTTSTST